MPAINSRRFTIEVLELYRGRVQRFAAGLAGHTSASRIAGIYRIAAIEPGLYTVEFAKLGFQPVRLEIIEVGSTDERILNQRLAVAGTSTSITVSAAPP
jgi:hypothetical protein